jgi:hypothetical protein
MSAVTIVPQVAVAHYKHAVTGVITAILWWLVLASFLRLAIFLADYYRTRSNATTS